MGLDYTLIGKRIKRRRKELGLTQARVEEKADLSLKYMSNIERGVSIPSTEVIMRIALALDTTPDEFLVGTAKYRDEEWKSVAELLKGMNEKQLVLAKSLLVWLMDQKLD